MNGWIILDKPSGITSAHAVAKVKRLLKPSKIGHAGTLDPLASGLLPLALGEATKTVAYLMDASKAYTFTVRWGSETDTDDSEGKVTAISEKRPLNDEIIAILPEFTGKIQQTPPCYSAIKVDGERAYDLARAGETVTLKAREVRVDSLQLLTTPSLTLPPQGGGDFTTFLCHCGKGTYIRSLARDMGRRLGCYGHVTALRRIKLGKFDENQAILLENLEEIVHKGELGFLQPVASALDDIPAVPVTADQAASLMRGQAIAFPPGNPAATLAAMHDGTLIAICESAQGRMKPRRVFNLT